MGSTYPRRGLTGLSYTMKRSANFSIAAAALALTACGGGGNSSNQIPPPPSSPQIVNTSLQSYLPFHSGNTWTFANGSRMVDAGSITIGCSCAINGIAAERIDLYNNAGYIGSQVLAKGNWPLAPFAGHRFTYAVGSEQSAGGAISFLGYSSDGLVPGVPLIDDTPVANETLTFSPPLLAGQTDVTIIANVGGTQALGNQIIQNVAIVGITGPELNIAYSFAPGIGFTGLSVGNGPIALSSFSINPNSTSGHVVKPNEALIGSRDSNGAQMRAMLLKMS